MQYAEELQRLWDEGFKAAVENRREGKKNTAPKGGVKYAKGESFTRDKYFNSQVDQWKSKKDGTRIKVGVLHEGSALNRVGFPAEGMWFDVGKIKKGFEKHGDHLTRGILKQIPELLNNPIAITEYKGPKGDIKNTATVYGLIMPDGKTPIAVGVMMAKGRNGTSIINKIRTIHMRGDAEINDQNILYLNEEKKRTRKWFQVCDITVPLEGTTFGLIRSIAYVDENSNTKNSVSDSVSDRSLLLEAAEREGAGASEELRRFANRVKDLEGLQRRLERQEKKMAGLREEGERIATPPAEARNDSDRGRETDCTRRAGTHASCGGSQ